MNLAIFLSSYFIIIISVIGYSLVFQNILRNTIDIEFEYSLLGTLSFLIFLSFLTHFFFSHGYIHNSIILIVGIISFLFFFSKEKKTLKKYYKFIIPIFVILIIASLTAKTHDDFPYYHFPYTYYLTQENLIIGTGNINHGFRTPSSIFYLNSLFYLPFIKYFSFNMGAILIFGVSNLILISKLKNDYQKRKYDFIFILTLLSFLFINIFFYRLAEHGTDRSAQILIFVLFIEVFSLFRKSIKLKNFFSKIFIILSLIISLKAFYVLYLLIFFPIFFHLKKKNVIEILFQNIYFYIFLFIGLFLIIINIFNSGCFLYPVSITCFGSFDWSLSHEVKEMNNWYEQWSKAGAGPNYRVDDPENYIKGFNWVSNWIDIYFFNKISDFLLGLFVLLTVVFLTFLSKKNIKIKIKIKNINYLVYSILIILFLEWFYNHPSLRYGGYSLIALIIFFPFSIYISSFVLKKNLKEKIFFLILFSVIIFVGRNIDRVNDEVQKYNYNIFVSPFYVVDENHLRIDNFIKKSLTKFQNCIDENKVICDSYEGISVTKKNNYFFLKRDK